MKAAPHILDSVKSHFEEVSWPSFPSDITATLVSLLRYMERSQWFTPSELAAGQHQQLVSLASYAQAQSPYFRQRLEEAGLQPQDLSTPEGLSRLPVMTRRDIQNAGDSLYCAAMPKSHGRMGEAKTSGSTGEPVNVRKTTVNSLFWQACMMREHVWHGRDINQRLLATRSHEFGMVQQSSWGNPTAMLFSSNGNALILPITMDIKEQVKQLIAFKPYHLLVYPNSLEAIINQCEKEGITIEGVKHIWFFAESVTPRLRQRAAEFFCARTEDNYSSQELGIMALQCPQESDHYHVMSESVILEVLDENGDPCAAGQTGRIVVTDLHNFATPMIRYAVGDYAQKGEACPCGRGLPVLSAIHGRARNILVKPGGVRHWPRLNFDEYKYITRVTQYQIIQHALDDIEVRLVAQPRLTDEEEAELVQHLQTQLEHAFPMRFTYFEEKIPTGANGKFEEFISHCA